MHCLSGPLAPEPGGGASGITKLSWWAWDTDHGNFGGGGRLRALGIRVGAGGAGLLVTCAPGANAGSSLAYIYTCSLVCSLRLILDWSTPTPNPNDTYKTTSIARLGGLARFEKACHLGMLTKAPDSQYCEWCD